MSTSPTSEPESPFVCDCDKRMHSACAGEPFYNEHEGKRYCVLHFPGKEKSADFSKVLQRKLDDKHFNFRGALFPDEVLLSSFDFSSEVDFRFATFSAEVDFRFATFRSKVSFEFARFSSEADFRDATFRAEANFSNATFDGFTYFTRAGFSTDAIFTASLFATRAFFTNATFRGRANFTFTTFSERVYFQQTTILGRTYFTYTSFQGYVLFSGSSDKSVFSDKTSLDFQFARIERPERISFHTLTLRPHWFVNLDTRKLDFFNVDWNLRKNGIDQEIKRLEQKKISPAYRLLTIVCRHLAVNAEENHRYDEASKFRYMAMDVQRSETWRGLVPWKLSWWYWLASGYGERVLKAFLVLLGIWFIAGLLYSRVGFARWEPKLISEIDVVIAKRDDVGAPLKFGRALAYSAGVMMLQKPEPRPATSFAQFLTLLETILGPVQAALLALAIRRKFMR